MRIQLLALCGASVLASHAAIAAPVSKATIKFAGNVRSVANFLDRSSRLALDNSRNGRIKSFARGEASEQTAALNSIVAWRETAADTSSSNSRTPKSPLGFVSTPLRAAGSVATDVADQMDDVAEGRSVALDESPKAGEPVQLEEIVLPRGTEDLVKLEDLDGRRFDELYRSTQRDALLQLGAT